jgi:hypothetical protein
VSIHASRQHFAKAYGKAQHFYTAATCNPIMPVLVKCNDHSKGKGKSKQSKKHEVPDRIKVLNGLTGLYCEA